MHYVILGLLLSGPLSSYDVHQRFKAGISLFYSASLGGIQRSLKQLLADGAVTVTEVEGTRRGTKLHTITDSGRDTWHAWMLAPTTGGDPETVMLAKVFFLGLLGEEDRGVVVAGLRERAARGRAALGERAVEADGQHVPEELADHFRYQRATLDFGIRAHDLALAWLDELATTGGRTR